MRDGMVNRPSVGTSGLISAREIVPHATSREDKAYGWNDWKGADARGTLAIFTQSEWSQRGRIATFAPGHWQTERRRSQDIVVSARGWLVVNPVGVATPTVGWKRAPLSAVASIAEVISDKCFACIAFWNLYAVTYIHGLWNCKCFLWRSCLYNNC